MTMRKSKSLKRGWSTARICVCLLALSLLTLHHSAELSPNEDKRSEIDGTLRRIRIPVLMYHYISPLPADADQVRLDLTVEPNLFEAHMNYLKSQGYTALSLYEIDEALRNGRNLTGKPIVLTFDDGYIDHYTYVFPILKNLGFVGTFFVITGFADNNYPGYMTWQQIQEMANAGMDMEPHTKDHVDLRQRDRDFLIYEIMGSIESLDAHTNYVSRFFAYPSGQYDDSTLKLLGETPVWRAFTTENSIYQTTDNELESPRLRIHGNMGVTGLEQLLKSP